RRRRAARGASCRGIASEVAAVEVREPALAALDPVGAVGLEREARAVAHVDVRVAPRIERNPVDVAFGLPVLGDGWGLGPPDERVEPLLGGRVRAGVQAVEAERLLERLHVRHRLRPPRVLGPAEDLRRDERREEPQDEHDDHDLEEREAGGGAAGRRHRTSPFSSKSGRRIAATSARTTPPIARTSAGSTSAVAAATAAATAASCVAAARSRVAASVPPRSPTAARRTRSGGKAPVRASAGASASPSRTASRAASTARAIGALPTASAAIPSAGSTGTPLATSVASVRASRAT